MSDMRRRGTAWAVLAAFAVGAHAADAPTPAATPAIQPAATQAPVDREAVLEHVLALARRHAINASKVDWATVDATARQRLASTPGEAGLTDALRYALAALGDRHSHYRPPVVGRGTGARIAPPPIAEVRATAGGIPMIAVNGWSGAQEQVPAAARSVRDALLGALATPTCGIVVDLRGNSGGNMWPMMAGLLPLYDAGELLRFERRDGSDASVGAMGDALVYAGQPPRPGMSGLARPAHAPRFVAVLIGPRTSSSGEITAIGFKGQANVRMFGQPTDARSSSNASYPLPNGGMVALTTAHVVDRTGRRYGDPVQPDVAGDAPVEDADRWLRSRCAAGNAPTAQR